MPEPDTTPAVRSDSLPCTPPPEWEFHTWYPLPGGGGDLAPGQHARGAQVRRLVTYGQWEPVRPDHWADEWTTTGSYGRTETGATTAEPQAQGGGAGDTGADGNLRAGIAKVLGIGSPTATDHDLIENVRAALIYRFRADQEVLLKDEVLHRETARADTSEATVKQVREIADRLIAHAAGFQDVLDDTDRDPWARTVRADLNELRTALTPPAPGGHDGEGQ